MTETRQQRRFRIRNGGPRTPGFEPLVGRQQARNIQRCYVQLLSRSPEIDKIQCWQTALSMANRLLPALAFARRHRAPRPSKSDDPLYRNPALRVPAAACAA